MSSGWQWDKEPFARIEDTLITYAWPGGYPVFYLDGSDDVLCPKCACESERTYRDGVLGDMCAWCQEGCLPWEYYEPEGYGTGVDCDNRPFERRDFENNWEHEHKLRPKVGDINYEDTHLYCAECNRRIESAYAED